MKVNKLSPDYGRKIEGYRGHFGYLSVKREKAWEVFIYSLSLEKYL